MESDALAQIHAGEIDMWLIGEFGDGLDGVLAVEGDGCIEDGAADLSADGWRVGPPACKVQANRGGGPDHLIRQNGRGLGLVWNMDLL